MRYVHPLLLVTKFKLFSSLMSTKTFVVNKSYTKGKTVTRHCHSFPRNANFNQKQQYGKMLLNDECDLFLPDTEPCRPRTDPFY